MTQREDEPEENSVAHFEIGAVYAKYRDLMHRVAFVKLDPSGRADEADDVVQDVIVGMMGSMPSGVKNWEAYLVRAVQNKATDRLRSAAVKHDGGPIDEATDHETESDPDIADEVVEAIEQQHRGAIVWDCLSVLDDRERKVLREYVVKGRPRKEVALELGVSPQRITQLRDAGFKKLKDALRLKGVHE